MLDGAGAFTLTVTLVGLAADGEVLNDERYGCRKSTRLARARVLVECLLRKGAESVELPEPRDARWAESAAVLFLQG